MNIDRNELLRQSLPGLYAASPVTQEDVYQQFFEELHHFAWKRMGDEERGYDAATKGICQFFTRCSNGPLEDESNPLGYLYECVRGAVAKLWMKDNLRAVTRKIESIVPGSNARVVVLDHGLTGKEPLKVSKSKTVPPINGQYGSKTQPYRVLDRDTIELPASVQTAERPGYLHYKLRKPEVVGFQSSINGEDSPSWEPQEHREAPASDHLDSSTDPRSQTLEQLLDTYGHSLTEMERLILTMKALGYTNEEIGKEIGRTADNVRNTNMPKAFKKLRAAIARSGDMDEEPPDTTHVLSPLSPRDRGRG